MVMASRKLRHYFTAHDISVPTALPLKDIFTNTEATGRIGKWDVELALFGPNFVARNAINSQALADFVADWTLEHPGQTELPPEPLWVVSTDGAWGAAGAGAGAVVQSPSGSKLLYSARLTFPCTNNTVEYEALLLGLRKARALEAQRVNVLKSSPTK